MEEKEGLRRVCRNSIVQFDSLAKTYHFARLFTPF